MPAALFSVFPSISLVSACARERASLGVYLQRVIRVWYAGKVLSFIPLRARFRQSGLFSYALVISQGSGAPVHCVLHSHLPV